MCVGINLAERINGYFCCLVISATATEEAKPFEKLRMKSAVRS